MPQSDLHRATLFQKYLLPWVNRQMLYRIGLYRQGVLIVVYETTLFINDVFEARVNDVCILWTVEKMCLRRLHMQ